MEKGNRLVLRLRRPLSPAALAALNRDFRDILVEGTIEAGPAHPDEADESELASLPRLGLYFDRRNFGRLRQLIDRINRD